MCCVMSLKSINVPKDAPSDKIEFISIWKCLSIFLIYKSKDTVLSEFLTFGNAFFIFLKFKYKLFSFKKVSKF